MKRSFLIRESNRQKLTFDLKAGHASVWPIRVSYKSYTGSVVVVGPWAAFDITGCKTSATSSVILWFTHTSAWQKITVILEMQAAWNLPSATVPTSAVTMLIKLSGWATWDQPCSAAIELHVNSLPCEST